MTRPTKILISFFLLSAAGCASTPNTVSNADPQADFSQYRTYGFFDPLATDDPNYESIESNFLKVAMAQELDKRGLAYSENPDLKVNFFINTQEKIRSRSVPTMGAYYAWRDPFFYDPFMAYPAYEQHIEQYTQGTLNVDVVDVEAGRLVWEGAVSGRITDHAIRNLESTVDGAISAVMDAFPIQPTGAH